MRVTTRKEAVDSGLKFYFTGKPCKHGHIAKRYTDKSYCIECSRTSALKSQKKNPEKKLKNQSKYRAKNIKLINQRYHNNKEEYSNRSKAYYAKNKKQIIERVKKYSEENREKRLARSKAYYQKVKSTDKFKASSAAAYAIRNVMDAIRKKNKDKVVGMHSNVKHDIKEFKERIESMFTEGMSWSNYGEWHIDHIKPIIAFIDEGIFDPDTINDLSNLQPLWALDNLRKGGKYGD